MKRIYTVIILSLLVFPVSTMFAQGDCSSCTIYNGYISGSMGIWKKGMHELEEQQRRDPKACTLYTLAEARYGYIGYLLGRNDKAAARQVIESFSGELDKLALHPEYRAPVKELQVAARLPLPDDIDSR